MVIKKPLGSTTAQINFQLRFLDSANAAFLDGHVESFSWATHVDVPGDNFLTPEQAALMTEKRLGFLDAGNLNDPVKRDELYDRN